MHYTNIQALRAIAALLVLVMHLIQVLAAFYAYHAADAGLFTLFAPYVRPLGLIGVDLFFVISGFVLYLSARRTIERGMWAGRFARARFLRIYPLYWVVFVFTAASTEFVIPGRLSDALGNWREWLLVDTSNDYEIVAPAWTLMYEVYFYAWIALIIALIPQRLGAALLAWVGLHAGLVLGTRFGLIPALNPVTDAILFDFAAGMGIAHLARRGALPHAGRIALAAFFFLAAGFVFLALQDAPGQVDRIWRLATFGVFSMGIVYCAVAWEQRGHPALPGLGRLGDASYSIYIWHVPVFWTLNWTGSRLGIYGFQHPYWTALVWGATALGVALLSYRWIERPLLMLMRTKTSRHLTAV